MDASPDPVVPATFVLKAGEITSVSDHAFVSIIPASKSSYFIFPLLKYDLSSPIFITAYDIESYLSDEIVTYFADEDGIKAEPFEIDACIGNCLASREMHLACHDQITRLYVFEFSLPLGVSNQHRCGLQRLYMAI